MSDPDRNSSPYPSNNERSPNVEALFLLQTWLTELDELRLEITRESAKSMQFIVESRAAGPATDITAMLLNAQIEGNRLDEWHKQCGSFGEHGAAYYRGGLLYGAEFAQMIHRRLLKHELVATSLEAYDAALDFVESSYELEAVRQCDEGWQRTEARGRAVAGCDLLSIVSATLHDHFATQIAKTIDSSVIDERDLEALHCGMIDATAFYWAYAAVLRGEIPQFHASPKDYIPTFDAEKHLLVPSRIRLNAEDSLRALVGAQEDIQKEDIIVPLPQPLLSHLNMEIPIMLVQTGANEFCYAVNLSELYVKSTPAVFFRGVLKAGKRVERAYERIEGAPVISSAVGGIGMVAVASLVEGELMNLPESAILVAISMACGAILKLAKRFPPKNGSEI